MQRFQRYSSYTPLIGIFSFAFFVRLIYNVTSKYVAENDASLYNHIAYRFAYQGCFCIFPNHPEISRAPLWPLLLSFFYRITPQQNIQSIDTGVQVFAGRLLCCFIGSFTCVLIYLLARDLFGKRIALVAGGFAAIYTGLFIYDGWIYSESLYTFLITAFVFSLVRTQRSAQWRWILLGGISLGLANLTRPNGPLLFAMLFLWALGIVLAKVMPWQTAIKSTLAMSVIALLLILPWTYRNYQVTHSFVLVAIGTGDVLLGSYNDNVVRENTGLWTGSGAIRPRPPLPQVVLDGKDTPEYTVADDQIATDYALQWMGQHVSDMPKILGYHLLEMWLPFTSIEHGFPFREFPTRLPSRIVWALTLLMPIPIYALAFLGLLATWKRWKKQLLIVYIVIALTIVENVAFWGDMRFRAPIEPLLVLLAAGALWWFANNAPANWQERLHLNLLQEQPDKDNGSGE